MKYQAVRELRAQEKCTLDNYRERYERLVEDVALTSFDARLARALLRLADEDMQVHATHEQLATETASGRAFVSRRLAHFARNGLVERHRGHIALKDKSALVEIAADDV